MRDDDQSGSTACTGAAAMAANAANNDFVHGTDQLDEDTHDDRGTPSEPKS